MNSANDKYGTSLDRPPAVGKPVDPATRLSELLAQSLEELTRPFDPARPGQHPPQPAVRDDVALVPPHEPPAEPQPETSPEEERVDADKALAELEAELFAAARQVDRDGAIPHEETDPAPHEETEPAPPGDGPPEPALSKQVENEMAAMGKQRMRTVSRTERASPCRALGMASRTRARKGLPERRVPVP